MKYENDTSSSGLGLGGVLGVIFIVLKLIGVIDWSWWWVLSPFWISFLLFILIVLGSYCYYSWDDKRCKKH